jgi:hypothetical protein
MKRQLLVVFVLLASSPVWGQIQSSVPPPTEAQQCVSGFCLRNGYKKLETPITEGTYMENLYDTEKNSDPFILDIFPFLTKRSSLQEPIL